jgi:hypothetical protein
MEKWLRGQAFPLKFFRFFLNTFKGLGFIGGSAIKTPKPQPKFYASGLLIDHTFHFINADVAHIFTLHQVDHVLSNVTGVVANTL